MSTSASTLGFDTRLLARLDRLTIPTRRTFRGGAHGERRAATHGASTEFLDHRPYVPGDDLRHLDWNLLARHDRLYLKRFHDQQEVRVHVVLDASASMGACEPDKFDLARRLAAAIAYVGLGGLDRVAVHALAGGGARASLPFQGRRSARRLFEHLAELRPAGTVQLAASLTAIARTLRRPSIVVVLSDLLSPGACAGLERFAAARHQVHAIHVMAPEERAPAIDGDVRLIDSETGHEVVVSVTPRLRRIYLETVAGLDAELERTARRTGVATCRILSDTPFETAVFRDLRTAGLFE